MSSKLRSYNLNKDFRWGRNLGRIAWSKTLYEFKTVRDSDKKSLFKKKNIFFQVSVSSSSQSSRSNSSPHMTLEELRAINKYAESTKSLSYLPQVRLLFMLSFETWICPLWPVVETLIKIWFL